jgi:fibronectin type 3 domain-containing protein
MTQQQKLPLKNDSYHDTINIYEHTNGSRQEVIIYSPKKNTFL